MGSLHKSKFDEFRRLDLVYGTVACHSLWTSILTPKGLVKERHGGSGIPTHIPVLVFWHGGGFIVGDRLYEPWWPGWLLQLAVSQNAMIVAPDYRLLPEASGADIVDDLHSFWTWFLEILPSITERESWGVRPDLSRIICAGHSAGGTLALLSALERPEVAVKAVLSLYGPLDDSVPELKISRPRMILGSWPPPPRRAEATIRSYVQKTRGKVRTDGDPTEMWELVTCILQQGRLPRMMNQRPDPRLDVIATIKKNGILPPIWMIHGENDSVVPTSCSTEFVRRVEEIVPNMPKLLSIQPGEHNFDASMTMKEGWIADGCDFILRYW
ncbi:putative polyketide synthase [Truncatella angustata]|uniref:Polyketide synthase n=1 Tax=Truncatella angustata TaxID=152316 RepID=A0A9P8ZUI1_9PEZI|nr:putative polyketide synthase [Truncatella angustata]KAH6649116.1 putative polyketide synthase [Truncatella angustata]